MRTVKGEANELLGAWAPRHAARLSNRFQRHRPSGLSSFVLLWDHTWKGALLAFGEVCLVRRDVDRLPSKFDARWQRALYVGHDDSSNAHIVLTSSGVQLSRSIRRLTVEHQRDRVVFEEACGTPWNSLEDGRVEAHFCGKQREREREERPSSGPSRSSRVSGTTKHRHLSSQCRTHPHGDARVCPCLPSCASLYRAMATQPSSASGHQHAGHTPWFEHWRQHERRQQQQH